MSSVLSVSFQQEPAYSIYYENHFEQLPIAFNEAGLSCDKICIITDSNVSKVYLQSVTKALSSCCRYICHFVFEAGEEQKNLTTITSFYEFLINEHFDRKDILVALGGGVTGDMTGFVAATYLRGIRFIQIPTTLLAQVDSSIGGKTGVDYLAYKNMIGAFHMPSLVYMNLATLHSLPKREFSAGISELIKTGLIKDESLFEKLENHATLINALDYASLQEVIFESCSIKKDVVEKDPFEKGERAILNFGHTLGHAIERYYNFTLLHGECVSLGSVASAYISFQKGLITQEDLQRIEKTFSLFNLPIQLEDLTERDYDEILKIVYLDKKMEAGKIKYILLNKIGEALISTNINQADMKNALIYLTKKEFL